MQTSKKTGKKPPHNSLPQAHPGHAVPVGVAVWDAVEVGEAEGLEVIVGLPVAVADSDSVGDTVVEGLPVRRQATNSRGSWLQS